MRRFALLSFLLILPAFFAACGGDTPRSDQGAAEQPRSVAEASSSGADAQAAALEDARGFTRGDSGAPVVVHEFADFQCPACRMAALEFLPYLEGKYIETGDVRYVFLDLPLVRIHPNSVAAHMAARCAGDQDAFFPYHDRLYEEQQGWSEANEPIELFVGYAEDLGLDGAELRACVEEDRHREVVMENRNLAMELEAQGTPTFYVNGEEVYGAGPQIVEAIDAAVAEAGAH